MTEPHAVGPTDDTWSMLALPPNAAPRHYRLLLALRTFPPHPVTGVRSMTWPRLVAATGLSDKTAKAARDELVEWGVIQYTPGLGSGHFSEYWIVPVAPVKVDAPPAKGGTQGSPFLVPGRPLKGSTPQPGKGGTPGPEKGVPTSLSPAETQTQGEVPQGEVLQEKDLKTTANAGSTALAPLVAADPDYEDQDLTTRGDETDLGWLVEEDIASKLGGLDGEEERTANGMLAGGANRLAVINKIKADRRRLASYGGQDTGTSPFWAPSGTAPYPAAEPADRQAAAAERDRLMAKCDGCGQPARAHADGCPNYGASPVIGRDGTGSPWVHWVSNSRLPGHPDYTKES